MTLPLLICRKNIDVRSGAGQVIANQARYFRHRGHDVTICCDKLSRGGRAALRGVSWQATPQLFRRLMAQEMRSRRYVARVSRLRRASDGLIIDHGQTFADPDIGYVHNFLAPQHSSRVPGYLDNEHYPWSPGRSASVLIANSHMVRHALIERLQLPDSGVVTEYPGYDPDRFSPELRQRNRSRARRDLGIGHSQPLIGLVTSGNFEKRGLDRFLECVSELQTRHAGLQALILGGQRLPRVLLEHPVYKSGLVQYRTSSFVPEQFFAAMDLLLYPARYEEFGVVVLEAMAMGIPVITSTAVGASELLVSASDRLVITAANDDYATYCDRATSVLELHDAEQKQLGSALYNAARRHTHAAHNRRMQSRIDCLSATPRT